MHKDVYFTPNQKLDFPVKIKNGLKVGKGTNKGRLSKSPNQIKVS